MRILKTVGIAILLIIPLSGCKKHSTSEKYSSLVEDETAKNISPDILILLGNTLEKAENDPSSVKLRQLSSPSKNIICGEINTKNSSGGYRGFSAFSFSKNDQTLNVAPKIAEVPKYLNPETWDNKEDERVMKAISDVGCPSGKSDYLKAVADATMRALNAQIDRLQGQRETILPQ